MAKPLKRCSKSGCRKLIDYDKKFCEVHQGSDYKEYNKARWKNERELMQFYNSKSWRELSKYKLDKDPLCEICLGNNLVEKAEMVHHIIEVKKDWSKRLDLNNLQSVSNDCHRKIKHDG